MCYIVGIGWVSRSTYILYKQAQRELEQLMKVKKFYLPSVSCFVNPEYPIVIPDGMGDYKLNIAEWGVIAPWIKTREEANIFKRQYSTYNAKGEELLEKKLYMTPARKNRCLVPVNGFYESRHLPKYGKKGQELKEKLKIPYHITLDEPQIFYMAGIFQPWFDHAKDDWINTFSICTTQAGWLMKQVHNSKERQPVILTPELSEIWLSKHLPDKEIIELASYQYDNSKLRVHTVSNDSLLTNEKAFEEVHYDNIPALEGYAAA